jgi:hypothetical protein
MPVRPAPQLRARRGVPVLHQHHHQSHCHHHLAYHRHRGSSINNNSSKGSGRPASKVIGKSRALSKCPLLISPIGLATMLTGINRSLTYQDLFFLRLQSRSHWRVRFPAASISWL